MSEGQGGRAQRATANNGRAQTAPAKNNKPKNKMTKHKEEEKESNTRRRQTDTQTNKPDEMLGNLLLTEMMCDNGPRGQHAEHCHAKVADNLTDPV